MARARHCQRGSTRLLSEFSVAPSYPSLPNDPREHGSPTAAFLSERASIPRTHSECSLIMFMIFASDDADGQLKVLAMGSSQQGWVSPGEVRFSVERVAVSTHVRIHLPPLPWPAIYVEFPRYRQTSSAFWENASVTNLTGFILTVSDW
jgi:hypothetical protein